MFKICFFATLIVLSFGIKVDGSIIYDNGSPSGSLGSIISERKPFNDPNGNQAADDFVLSSTSTIRSVTVYFYKEDFVAPDNPLKFDIEFFDDVGSTPGINPIFTTTSVGNTSLGNGLVDGTYSNVDNIFGEEIYAYNFDLAADVDTGTWQLLFLCNCFWREWDYNASHLWAVKTGSGGNAQRRKIGSNSETHYLGRQSNSELAFSLSDTYLNGSMGENGAIPEPASIVVWSVLGCFGAAGAYRKNREKKQAA